MTVDLVDLAKSALTPSVMQKLSGLVDESPATTEKAVGAMVPALLGGLAQYASTGTGATSLLNSITREPAIGGGGLPVNFGDLLSGGAQTQQAMSTGRNLLSTILGSKLGSVTDLITGLSGAKASSVMSLGSLLLPLIMGVLGRQVSSQGLSAAGLASLLTGQRDAIARSAPAGLSSLLGLANLGDVGGFASRAATTAAHETREAGRNWLWPVLGALALLLLGWWLIRGLNGPTVQQAAAGARAVANRALAALTLPDGSSLQVYEGSIGYNLARFLQNPDASQLPKTFVFDDLNFETGSTALTPDSYGTVDKIVAIMKAYSGTGVNLVGHTDNTGDPASNRALSLSRANVVRDRMVNAGIAGDRITTEGYGQDRPIASNNTEEGRATNRRTELVVVRVK